jgi:hypothetical protein
MDCKIGFCILLIPNPQIVVVQAILVPVTDDQCGLTRIAMKGDVVSDETVSQGILLGFVGNEKIQMSLKPTGLLRDPIFNIRVKRILNDFLNYDAFL